MTTYDFVANHQERICPALIPAMDEYIVSWLQDEKDIVVFPEFSSDLRVVIYPYLAAYRALTEAGVADAEKHIVEMRAWEGGQGQS